MSSLCTINSSKIKNWEFRNFKNQKNLIRKTQLSIEFILINLLKSISNDKYFRF